MAPWLRRAPASDAYRRRGTFTAARHADGQFRLARYRMDYRRTRRIYSDCCPPLPPQDPSLAQKQIKTTGIIVMIAVVFAALYCRCVLPGGSCHRQNQVRRRHCARAHQLTLGSSRRSLWSWSRRYARSSGERGQVYAFSIMPEFWTPPFTAAR